MRRFSTVLAILGMLGLGALGTACQRSQESEVTRTEDGVLRLGRVEVVDTVARAVAPNDRPLVLEGMRGSVYLTGADRSTADFSFVRRGRGSTREDGQAVLEGISITESGTESEYMYTLAAERSDYAAVDVHGRVPRSTALRIDRLSGPVRVEDVEAALTIEHEHGDVTVSGAAGPVETTIKNGDVTVGFQTLPTEGTLRMETANGDLHLHLPPEASARIDARTDVGTIRTRDLSVTTEQFAPINAGARYTTEVGDGGPTVELRTQNGSITISATAPTDSVSGAATVPDTDTVMAPQPDADTTDKMGIDTMTVDTTATDSVF